MLERMVKCKTCPCLVRINCNHGYCIFGHAIYSKNHSYQSNECELVNIFTYTKTFRPDELKKKKEDKNK